MIANNRTINDNFNEINPNIKHITKAIVGKTVLIEYKQNTLFILAFDLNNSEFIKQIATTVKKLKIIMNNIAIKNILKYGICVLIVKLLILALYIAVKYSFVITPYNT